MMRAATEEIVDHVAIIGSAAECRERLAELTMPRLDEVPVQLTGPCGGLRETIDAITAREAAL